MNVEKSEKHPIPVDITSEGDGIVRIWNESCFMKGAERRWRWGESLAKWTTYNGEKQAVENSIRMVTGKVRSDLSVRDKP